MTGKTFSAGGIGGAYGASRECPGEERGEDYEASMPSPSPYFCFCHI
jgi:hypothetical protein